jgi:restriction system protein
MPTVIREMFGIMTAEQADEAVIVTSGKFTSEAKKFAHGKSIKLVDGPCLLELVCLDYLELMQKFSE